MKKKVETYKIRQHWYKEAVKILELVKALRQRKGLSQKQICDKSAMLQPNLSKLENSTIIPRFDTMLALLDAVGIKVKFEYDMPTEEQCCKCGWPIDCIFYNTDACLDCKNGKYYDNEDK